MPTALQGHLKKQGEDMLKSWKKRYFKQTGEKLYYFNEENDLNPNGFIDLTQITQILPINQTQFDLLSPKRVYHLQVIPRGIFHSIVYESMI